jgi:hypothetical protein
MYSSITPVRKVQLVCALFVLCAMVFAPSAEVKAQAAPQGTLTVNKEVVGTTSPPSNFSFLINGASSTPFEADGSNQVSLATGTYDITEAQVSGYTTTYAGCENIVLTATNTPVCTITNTATATPTTTTGTLIVNKVVDGGPSATSSFSFMINGGATTTFEADGTNVITNLATGTYSITEVPVANYTPTYTNCTSVSITAEATTTCTITNNFNVGGAQLYEITGIVWDDEDEDSVLDGDESRLQNWTVSASQTGEITRTDATDSNGRYSLIVTDGLWTVIEMLQSGWTRTFPATGTHAVQATGTATTTLVLGDYNFGNNQTVIRDGGGGGGGGNGRRIELRDNDDEDDDSNGDDDDDNGGTIDADEDGDDDDDSGVFVPPGQVLGEQAPLFPYGAPATGEGGTALQKMDGKAALPLFSMVLTLLVGFGIVRALRDPYEEEEMT